MSHSKVQSASSIWSILRQQQLVNSEHPPENNISTPWFIRLMLGVAGWVGAFFILGFFAMVLIWGALFESLWMFAILGIIGNFVAYGLFTVSARNDFLQQLALVSNLAAQVMLAVGLYDAFDSFSSGYFLTLFGYQLLLVFAMPNYLSRVLTTWFTMFALMASLYKLDMEASIAGITMALFTVIWMNDLAWKRNKSLWEPIGYGLAIALLHFNGQFIWGNELDRWLHSSSTHWFAHYDYMIGEIIEVVVFIGLIWRLAKEYQIKIQSYAGSLMVLASLLLIILGYFIGGVSAALVMLVVGFMKQRKSLIGLGLVTLLGFISWYYYNLSMSLFSKSMYLFAVGGLLMLAYYMLVVFSGNKRISVENLATKYSMGSIQWIAVATLVVILGLVNTSIVKRERLLSSGEVVLLKLAPVDPRSIMQGDYMRLRFAIEADISSGRKTATEQPPSQNGNFIVSIDKNHVGHFSAIDHGQKLEKNQLKMHYKKLAYQIRIATNAFYFQEGSREIYQQAKYGEFRVDSSGDLLLNNLRSEDFKVLGLNRPSN